jgi:hypothetical protein
MTPGMVWGVDVYAGFKKAQESSYFLIEKFPGISVSVINTIHSQMSLYRTA